MKRSRFTEEQIIGVLKEQEAGLKVSDLEGSKNRWLMRLVRDFRLLAI